MDAETWVETPDSETVSRLAYDSASAVLTIEFTHGGRYRYLDVPRHVFDLMLASESKGQFLTRRIKGVYRYERV